MYPQGKAQTATRPVGNGAGRRTERVMHTIAKASLQADSRGEIFRKSMKITQNQAKMAPNSVPGASSGPSVAKRSPKSGPKHPKRDPKKVREHPWGPKGTPSATKGPQRAPRGSPRATLRDLGRGKIEQKSVTEAKKVDFGKSAPRLGPADARSTSDPLESLKNRLRMLQSRFLEHPERSFG